MSVVSLAAARLVRALPRRAISRAMGTLCEAELPAPFVQRIVGAYCRAYRVATEEACPSQYPYASFDAFFTRKLREGARPLEGSERTLISPADGKLSALGEITERGLLTVKGQEYTAAELLEDEALAQSMCGGAHFVVYLSPRDYHRVHAPCSGTLRRVRAIDGDRFPVNRLGERHVPQLFVRNRRVLLEVDSEAFGPVAVIMVGAFIVGRMSVSGIAQPDVSGVHFPNRPVSRGDEIGRFHLGSTVVVLIPPGRFAGFARGVGTVAYGQALGEATEAET